MSPGEDENKQTDPPELIIRSQVKNGSTLNLIVPLASPALSIISKIQAVTTGIIVLSGLLLIITASLLLIQIRKGRTPSPTPIPIDPLQNYLLNLKGKEIQMQQEVDVVRQLAEKKESLTGLILNQVHFAVITLGKGQRIETFNHQAEQIFKKSYASVVNCTIQDALQEYPEILQLLQHSEPVSLVREISTHDLTLSCNSIKLPHDGILITIEDITDEEETRKIDIEKKSLVQLGEMAAYLSHEVRNSLGVIFGYTKTLKHNDPKIDLINKEIHFLTDMMDRFLGFSKPTEPPQQVPCTISDLITELCTVHNIQVVQHDEVNSEAIADAQLLRNVLDNLIRNAVQAGASEIDSHYHRDKRSVELLFTDNGHGIPDSLLKKIWFPFFTTREKGSGMGLALVRKLVLAMNGEIHLLSSKPGETRFALRLPTTQA